MKQKSTSPKKDKKTEISKLLLLLWFGSETLDTAQEAWPGEIENRNSGCRSP